jgi:(R,R)-butanediol dehydrogenase / meso-butanediol dehydrogenase / diacetyl reductase
MPEAAKSESCKESKPTMKALRWHAARDLRLSDVELLAPGAGHVELHVAYCGICGSDLHEYQDGPHAIPHSEPHSLSGCRAPLTLGHEFCGVISAIGAGVVGLEVGDRVAVEPEYRCGKCRYCQEGLYNLCESMGFIGLMGDGGFAERALVPAYMLHRLPDSVSLRQAAVLEPAAVALHALRRSSLRPGQRCVVFGLGPIGLLLVMLARLRGIEDITAVDVSPERLKLAGEFGASRVIDARQADLATAQLREGAAPDSVFEAAGSQASLDAALGCLKKGGELVLVSLMGDIRLNAFDLVNRELRLLGSVGYRDVYPELIALLADGRLDLTRAVTRIVPLEEAVEQGFEELLRDKSQIKILVAPNPALADA